MVGIIESNPDRIAFPFNALGFKKACWLVISDSVYHNGMRTREKLPVNLDSLKVGQTIGIMVDSQSNLHLCINEVDVIVAKNVGSKCRALVVLYGETEQVN